jgi:hypothetical protein
MTYSAIQNGENAIALLRRLARPGPTEEQCELCVVPIPREHRHLLEVAKRQVVCACDPCALRFQGAVGGRYKLIPRDHRFLPHFSMTDTQWDNLALPINLAFFYRDSSAGKVVALYPSPAGATESLLPSQNWEQLDAQNPALAKMEADVEALLVYRIGEKRLYFISPIDSCYELVGIIRKYWRGFSGGEKVWQEIEKFFAALREKAGTAGGNEEKVAYA